MKILLYYLLKYIGIINLIHNYSIWLRTKEWEDGRIKTAFIKGNYKFIILEYFKREYKIEIYMNNLIRIKKLKLIEFKIRLLLHTLKPLRSEKIEVFQSIEYYSDKCYYNPYIYKGYIERDTKEHTKLQEKQNKILIKINKLNKERKALKISNRVFQSKLSFV